MFEEYDFDTLMDKMLSNVDDKLDKREGSIIYDAIAPAALELSNFYLNLDMVLDEVFAESASYYYLTKRAAERGLLPKEETNATLMMKVEPAETQISIGDRFNLDELNYTVASIIDGNAGAYQVQCETAGVVGNQQLGALIPIETENELNNMESATLEEVLIPGEDEEDVETFRERYFSSFNNEAFGGNKTDYIEKVNSIDGIGGCKPIRAWSGGYNPAKMIPTDEVKAWFEKQSQDTLGETVYNWLSAIYNASINKLLTVGGTVKLVIINSEFRKPSSTLINKVQEEIDPTNTAGEGDGIAPIGHVVNVVGVKEEPINITLSLVEYETGYSFDKLKDAIEAAVDNYLLDLRQTWASNPNLIVRTSQMEAQLLLIEGIVDMKAVLLNDQAENVTLGSDSIPVRGEVIG